MGETLRELATKQANVAHLFTQVLNEEVEPIRTDLNALKEKMSGETAQILERMNAELIETKAQLKTLQTILNRPGMTIGGYDSPELKKKTQWDAYTKALRDGWGALDTEQKKLIPLENSFGQEDKIGHGQSAAQIKAMYGADATTGGFLMAPEIADELIMAVVQVSDFHSLVNVRMTASPWVIIRKRTQTTSAARIPEQATRSETQNMKFGRVQVFPYTAYALSLVSNEDLEDSELDLGATIQQDFAEEFSKLEGYEIPNGLGAGANQCAGFLQDGDVISTVYPGSGGTTGYIQSSAVGGFTYDDLVNARQAMKPAYRKGSTWVMNTDTVGDLQKLTDSIGRPLLFDANGAPTNQLLGYPYQEMVDMPAVSSGNFPICFANWKKFYTVVIRKQVAVRIITERYIDQNAVGYLGYYRFGGLVTLSEAGHALKIQ